MKHLYRIFIFGVGMILSFIPSLMAHPNIVIELGSPVYYVQPYAPAPIYVGTSSCYHPYHSRGYTSHYSHPYIENGYVYDNRYGPGSSAAGRFSPVRTSNIYYGY